VEKKQTNYWKIALILIILTWFLIYLSTEETNNQNPQTPTQQPEQTKIQKLEKIVQNYHATHTYSKIDLFVCTDTSIDVWNLVKTEGTNAEICVGNVEENITQSPKIFENMNHAWVIAETEPFTWIALETTGDYLVWGDNKSNGEFMENSLYYHGLCFDNPSEFKEFLKLREDYFETCGEAEELSKIWNEQYVGTTKTFEGSEFKGEMDAKNAECKEVTDRLKGLLN